MKATGYIIITAKTLVALEKEVNERIKKGNEWEFLSAPFFHKEASKGTWHQVMVKLDDWELK